VSPILRNELTPSERMIRDSLDEARSKTDNAVDDMKDSIKDRRQEIEGGTPDSFEESVRLLDDALDG
jgi:hypothetical protein